MPASDRPIDHAAPEDPEAVWLRDGYRPDEPNLTPRGIVVGVLVGFVMSLSNVFVFFKTGWSVGVTLTACILAFSTFKLLEWFGARPLVPFANSLTIFVGAALAALARRHFPRHAAYTVPVASGLIAGESLVAIAITVAASIASQRAVVAAQHLVGGDERELVMLRLGDEDPIERVVVMAR